MTKTLNANAVLHRLSAALPPSCREDIIIVGSLSAAAQLLKTTDVELRTKDIDGMLAPNTRVVAAGAELASKLIEQGWAPRVTDTSKYDLPANAGTPQDKLPVVRLTPPGEGREKWFLELLGAPPTIAPSDKNETRYSQRIETKTSHFEIPSFAYLGVTQYQPVQHESELKLARVETMALSNLLHHPKIGEQRMSDAIEGLKIKRSNKDLGRVIAMAHLRMQQDDDAVWGWQETWRTALNHLKAPATTIAMLDTINSGIYALEQSHDDQEEALHAINNGLLSSQPMTSRQFTVALQRYLQATDNNIGKSLGR